MNAVFPKVKSVKRFIKIIEIYILFALETYKFSANTIFTNSADKKCFYNLIKQDKYNFSNLLLEQSCEILKDFLEKHKNHKCYDSWVSRNRITIVVDKMECPRTTSNFEKSKKLYKSDNGHYLINIAFVIGDSRYIFDLNSVLYDPDCGKSSIKVAYDMIIDCIEYLNSHCIEMNRIRLCVDREFLTKYIKNYCSAKGVSFITRAKSNTVFYDADFKFNSRFLKEYLYHICLDDFKQSVQLDSWSKKHNRPYYDYWTRIFGSNFGNVRVVAVKTRGKYLDNKNYKRNIHILISFCTELNAVQIIETYKGQRWQVEVFHKSYKNDLECVTSYVGKSFIGLMNHYILRAIGHLYLSKYRLDKTSWKYTIGKAKRYFSMLM